MTNTKTPHKPAKRENTPFDLFADALDLGFDSIAVRKLPGWNIRFSFTWREQTKDVDEPINAELAAMPKCKGPEIARAFERALQRIDKPPQKR